MKKIKLTLTLLSVLAGTFFMSRSVLAQNESSTPSGIAQKQQAKLQNQESKIANLKTRADKEIERRITSMNSLITKLNAMKKITSSDKSTLTSQIQDQITSLTNLKVKIDADTDLATLRTDVQSIVKAYRIFVVFRPKINIMAAADRGLILIDEMSQIATKFQTILTQMQGNGKDVSSLITTLTAVQTKLDDAKTQFNAALTELAGITPDGYPGNKTQLKDAHSKVQAGVAKLVSVRQDFQTIRQGIKSLGDIKSPTPTSK